jgi:hypothetical protein
MKINIQDEVIKIHHKYGTSEKANYEIQKLCESYANQKVEERNQDIKDWMENNVDGWYSELIKYLSASTISSKNYGDDGVFLSEEGFRQLFKSETTPVKSKLETESDFIQSVANSLKSGSGIMQFGVVILFIS